MYEDPYSTHHTIANNQIPEVPGTALFPFFLAINIIEALRASTGWVEPGLGLISFDTCSLDLDPHFNAIILTSKICVRILL